MSKESVLSAGVTRVIAIVLEEEEWLAFRAIEPDPVTWIRECVRARVGTGQPEAETLLAPAELTRAAGAGPGWAPAL